MQHAHSRLISPPRESNKPATREHTELQSRWPWQKRNIPPHLLHIIALRGRPFRVAPAEPPPIAAAPSEHTALVVARDTVARPAPAGLIVVMVMEGQK